MTDLAVLNPEIEGLLREIAADPTSSLLRLPPSDLRRARRHGHLPDRAGTTGLNLAERELLRRWREEVAYLLLVACYRELTATACEPRRVYRIPTSCKGRRIGSRVRRATAEGRRYTEGDERTKCGIDFIQVCFGAGGLARPTPYELASLSSELAASELSSAYAALSLLLSGNPVSALRLMGQIRPERPIPIEMVAMNTAHAYECVGRIDLALATVEEFRWPETADVPRAIAGVALSAQLGEPERLDRWARLLLAASEREPSRASSGIEELVHRRKLGNWSPTRVAKRFAVKTGRRYGGCVERVALAFA